VTLRVIFLARTDLLKPNLLPMLPFDRPGGSNQGFSLIELSLVLIVVAALLGVIGTRVFEWQANAEQTGVKSLLGTLDSALGMRVAQYQARQDRRGIEVLVGSNPMDNLERRPKNYRGELRDGATVEPGNWYFDRRSKALMYRVRNVERFRGGVKNPVRARFAVRLVFQDQNGNGVYDRDVEHLEGVRLMALEPYQWTN
jgi:prepilin-type N-terminal cleavage/methylation domain-containing protein